MSRTKRSGRWGAAATLGLGLVLVVGGLAELPAAASPGDPGLGSASSFAVLASSTITNTGPSVLTGDVGLSPGTSVTGFPPGTIVGGSQQVANGAAATAEADAQTGYNDAGSRAISGTVTTDLANQNLAPGVYAGTTLSLSGQLTLDGQNNPDATFILRSSSTLVTASGSSVALVNGAQACHVFWQVGSSATLATDSAFTGTVVADASITAQTGATIDGRVLALNGAVTLDDNTVSVPTCTSTTAGGSGAASATPTMSASSTATATTTPTVAPSGSTPPSVAPSVAPSASTAPSVTQSVTASDSPSLTPAPTPSTSVTPSIASPIQSASGTPGAFSSLVSTNVSALESSTAQPSATSSPDGNLAFRAGGAGSGGGGPVSPGGPLAYTGAHVSGLLEIGGAATILGVALFLLGTRPTDSYNGRHRRN